MHYFGTYIQHFLFFLYVYVLTCSIYAKSYALSSSCTSGVAVQQACAASTTQHWVLGFEVLGVWLLLVWVFLPFIFALLVWFVCFVFCFFRKNTFSTISVVTYWSCKTGRKITWSLFCPGTCTSCLVWVVFELSLSN